MLYQRWVGLMKHRASAVAPGARASRFKTLTLPLAMLALPMLHAEATNTVPEGQECSFIEGMLEDAGNNFVKTHASATKVRTREFANLIPSGAAQCELGVWVRPTLDCTWEYSKLSSEEGMDKRAEDLGKDVLTCLEHSKYRDVAWFLDTDDPAQVFIESGSQVVEVESRSRGPNLNGRQEISLAFELYVPLTEWASTRQWYQVRPKEPKFGKAFPSGNKSGAAPR